MQPAFLCLLTSKIFHDLQPAKRYACNSRKQQLQLEFSRDGKLAAVAPLNQEVGTIPYTTEEDNTDSDTSSNNSIWSLHQDGHK